MAITFGSGTTTALGADPTTASVTITGGTDCILRVGVFADVAVDAVTWDGVACTQIFEQIDGLNLGYSTLWLLVNPATGTKTVSVDFAAGVGTAQIWTQPIYGVAQGGTEGTTWRTPTVGNDGGSGTATATQTAANAVSGDMCIDTVHAYNQSITADGGQTVQYQTQVGGGWPRFGNSSEEATGSTTLSWTLGASTWWSQGVVPLIPAAAAAAAGSSTAMLMGV